VITICLFVAISAIFLRGFVYHDLSQADIPETEESSGQSSIILAYHERQPFYITGADNMLTGLVGTPAISAFVRSGLEYTLAIMPPSRVLKSIKNNRERICGVGWFQTPERQLYASFTETIYRDLPITVLTRADTTTLGTDLTLSDLLTTPNLTLLIKKGYSYGNTIDNGLTEHSPTLVHTTGDTPQMLEMIATGKADYFFIAAEAASILITESTTPELFRIIELRDMPLGNTRYIMCSKQVTETEIESLNQAISANITLNSPPVH
jgi:uncharacterized protein (TIGR02285 family)